MKKRSEGLLKYRKPEPSIEVVLFSSQRGYLASTKSLELLLGLVRAERKIISLTKLNLQLRQQTKLLEANGN